MHAPGRRQKRKSRRRNRRRVPRIPGMPLILTQYLLELSMKMEKKRSPVIRLAGRLIGFLPVRYSEYVERRLLGDEEKR